MKNYLVVGIQQIGIGVHNLEDAWKWYSSTFGMDCPIFEEEAEAKLMLPYTGGKPRKRHAVLALNLQSGGGFEIWQYVGREPVSFKGEIKLGDLGILACKIKVKDVSSAFEHYKKREANLLGSVSEDPSGEKTFFMKDPYGNIFQMVKASDWLMNEKKITGGSYGAIIGVSDIDRSLAVYSDILGYDRIIYDRTGEFSDLSVISGGSIKCRRMLLGRSEPFTGPFSPIFGESVIELVSASDGPGRRIYDDRYWGDPGFIHLCYDIRGMDELRTYCESKGFPFTVDSMVSHDGKSFDMGEAAGHFSYFEDADGILIEFVETHKIPIMKKFGWYLDLTRRDPHKKLPGWMLKTLRFSRVKPGK